MKKRLLIALMVAAMAVTLMPATTFADTVTPVEMLKATASGTKAVKLSWTKPSGATKFIVYGNKSGKSLKKLVTTTKTSYTVKKISGKKLTAHKYYKFYVVAYKGSTKLVQSRTICFITGKTSGKYANLKSIKINKSALTLNVGKTYTLKATKTVYKKKKHIASKYGTATTYKTNNASVATVSSKGVVTAVKPGTATIYVQDVGGLYCTSKITVPNIVKFDMQGHGTQIAQKNVANGGKITMPTAPTETDWQFGGWYKDSACTEAWDFSLDTVTEDITLYAKWNPYVSYFMNDMIPTTESDAWVSENSGKCYLDKINSELIITNSDNQLISLDTLLEQEGTNWTYSYNGIKYTFNTYYDQTLASITVEGETSLAGTYKPTKTAAEWSLTWNTEDNYLADLRGGKKCDVAIPSPVADGGTPPFVYSVVEGDSYFTIDNENSSVVTVKAGTPCDKYTLKIKAVASPDQNHSENEITTTFSIEVEGTVNATIKDIIDTISDYDAIPGKNEPQHPWYDKNNSEYAAYFWDTDSEIQGNIKYNTLSIGTTESDGSITKTRTDTTDTYYMDADGNFVFEGTGGTWTCIMTDGEFTSLIYEHNKEANAIFDGTYKPLSDTTINFNPTKGTKGKVSSVVITMRDMGIGKNSDVVPTRTGFTFAGWFTAQYDGTKVIDTKGALAKDVTDFTDAKGRWMNDSAEVTLYAQWTSTIEDVLNTLDGKFPTSFNKAWGELTTGAKCYIDGSDLVCINNGKKITKPLNTVLTETETGWELEAGSENITFTLKDGKLTTIDVTGITVDGEVLDGTYVERYQAKYTAPTAKSKLVYNGTSQALVTAGTSTEGDVYYSVSSSQEVPLDGWTTDVAEATNAGTYYVHYYVKGDTNHLDTDYAYVTVTIAKAAVAYTAPTAKTGLTYTGSSLDLVTAGSTNDGTMQYAVSTSTTTPGSGDWKTSIDQATNAGTYYVHYYVKADDNHIDSASNYVTVTIGKVIATCTAPVAKTGLTYTGSAMDIATAGSTNDGTMQYAVSTSTATPGSGDWKATIDQATDAGTYYVHYYVKADSNHTDSVPVCTEVSIAKADSTCTAPVAKTGLTYTGSAMDIATPGSTNDGTMQYAVSTSTATPEDSDWNATIDQVTDAGTYYVHYYVKADSNHNNSTPGCIEVLVGKATATCTAPVAKDDVIYTGSGLDLVTAGSTNDGTMQYAVSTSTTTPGSGDWKTSIDQATNAGTYYVHYYVKADGNHTDSLAAYITVTIAKATATCIAPVPDTTLVYDGTAQTLATAGETSDGVMKYAVSTEKATPEDSDWKDTIDQATDAGTYYVYYKVVGDDNHNDSTPDYVEATIAKAAAECTTAPVPNTTLVYDGTAKTLATAGVASNGTMKYVVDQTEADPVEGWKTTIDQATDAGTYYIHYYVAGDKNYSDTAIAKIAVTIAKIDAVYTAPVAKTDLTYKGSAMDIATPGSTDDGTMKYVVDQTEADPVDGWKDTIDQATDAGTYYIHYYVLGDDNHNNSTPDCVAVTIAKAVAAYTAPTAKDDLTYTGTAMDLATAGSTDDGTMMYVVDQTEVDPVDGWKDTIDQKTDAGTYYIHYYVVGDYNHSDSTPDCVEVTIAKADAACTPPTAEDGLVYSGELLSLITAGSTDDGTMQYALGESDNETPVDGWSEEIPKAMNAGIYYVYYKVEGDDNHNSSTPVCIKVTIAQADL